MTREEIIDLLVANITDNTNGENTAARVREVIEELINSSVNTTDDQFTSSAEGEGQIAFGGTVSFDLSSKRTWVLDVTENVVIDATGMKNGENYNFIFIQQGNTATVSLRPTFLTSAGFTMVTGNLNVTMLQCVAHGGSLYCLPQSDFT